MKKFTKKLKNQRLEIAKKHEEFDRFAQGTRIKYGKKENNMHRGSIWGCLMQTKKNTIAKASDAMHLPIRLLELGEDIFNNLPKKQAKLFPVDFIGAIPNNKDIINVRKRLILRLMSDEVHGLISLAGDEPEVKNYIERCVEVCKNFSWYEYESLEKIHYKMKKNFIATDSIKRKDQNGEALASGEGITIEAAFLLAARYFVGACDRDADETAITALLAAIEEENEKKDWYNVVKPGVYSRLRDILIEELSR